MQLYRDLVADIQLKVNLVNVQCISFSLPISLFAQLVFNRQDGWELYGLYFKPEMISENLNLWMVGNSKKSESRDKSRWGPISMIV